MQVIEHRRKAYGLPDLLLYASLVDDGVLLLQNGALMATWTFRGPDLSFATYAEMDGISRRLNSLLKLGSNWMVQCDAIRNYAPGYPSQGAFSDAVTRLMDEERRAQFMHEGSHLETDYFLSLTYLPPLEKEEKIKGYLYESDNKKKSGVAQRVLAFFNDKIASFDAMFAPLLRARRLGAVAEEDELGNKFYFDEQLRYVRRCIQGSAGPTGTVGVGAVIENGIVACRIAHILGASPVHSQRTHRLASGVDKLIARDMQSADIGGGSGRSR